jgi:putative flippase GtrA
MNRFVSHVPAGQVVRYLLVGAWNTFFGYGCFFALAWLFLKFMPLHPSLAASTASLVAACASITVSFIGYKFFVFKTKNNFLREFARSFLVYLPTLVINAIAIAPLTAILRRVFPHYGPQAPYVAGALLMCLTVVISFFGHKHISFRDPLSVHGDH